MTAPDRELLMAYYGAMLSRFGHRDWWPGDSPFEVCVGALLTQNTSWKNVKKAIDNLKAISALDPVKIHRMRADELAGIIKPAGYFNVKAKRLKNLVGYLMERHGGKLDSFFASPLESQREELLSINGVGPETADSILLYAGEKPVFVVDAYTKRVLQRHGLVGAKSDYDSIQAVFHASLPPDVALYNDFHAQFVAVGHYYCRTKPLCEDCPLRPLLDGRPRALHKTRE